MSSANTTDCATWLAPRTTRLTRRPREYDNHKTANHLVANSSTNIKRRRSLKMPSTRATTMPPKSTPGSPSNTMPSATTTTARRPTTSSARTMLRAKSTETQLTFTASMLRKQSVYWRSVFAPISDEARNTCMPLWARETTPMATSRRSSPRWKSCAGNWA